VGARAPERRPWDLFADGVTSLKVLTIIERRILWYCTEFYFAAMCRIKIEICAADYFLVACCL